jgi:hypothetical protein
MDLGPGSLPDDEHLRAGRELDDRARTEREMLGAQRAGGDGGVERSRVFLMG